MTPTLYIAVALLGQPPPDVQISMTDLAEPPYRVELEAPWRFRVGDDARFAQPAFDDASWATQRTALFRDDLTAEMRDAPVVWFRTRLGLAPRLVDRPVALMFARVGALEVFADGELVCAKGDVERVLEGGTTDVHLGGDACMVTFRRATPVLAVRFASPNVCRAAGTGYPGGFFAFLGEAEPALEARAAEVIGHNRLYFFFIGFAVALATLHLLVFFFLPDIRANLYYALATYSVASLSVFVMLRLMRLDFALWTWAGVGFSVSLILLANFGVKFFYAIVGEPRPLGTKVYHAIGVGLILASGWVPVWLVYVYASVGLFEQARMGVMALLKRMQDGWIIFIGLAGSLVFSMIQMLPAMLGLKEEWLPDAYIYGFGMLLMSMSIYLARDFARTQRNLRHRLVEVRLLSEATIEQERRAKSEEMQRVKLEEENKRQALELDEAKKRQEVLEQLEATNRELHQTQAQLVQSEKMASLGQLVAGIAHEINTPVGAIHSVHDSLARATEKLKGILRTEAPLLVEEHKKLAATMKIMDDALQVIDSGSSRVAKIVQRLKTFARLDEAELQRASLEEGLDDTLLLIHHELKRGITVHKDFAPAPPIPCFPGQLNQVFLNLLVNAKQAIGCQGEIFVRTEVVGDRVHVSVRDTGAGIPKANLKRIFDPGFTTKGVKVGTGLGLSICYRIVADHLGEIRVESVEGQGSTFTVVLPMDLDVRIERRCGALAAAG